MAGIKKTAGRQKSSRVFQGLFALVLLAGALGGFWYWRKTQSPPVPVNLTRILFEGIAYQREILRQPRPLVVHVVKVDLRSSGRKFLVTPPDSDRPLPLKARTTSQFRDESRAQVAINGDFFDPWHSRTPWDYYPHVGDPVQVQGLAASQGHIYSSKTSSSPVLVIGKDNRADIFDSSQSALKHAGQGRIENAISGNALLVRNGKAASAWKQADLHPRVAVGLDKQKQRMIIVVVDGRQKHYSEGVSSAELANLMVRHGAYDAINFDGGGSATLVIEAPNGKSEVLNSPIDHGFPGSERAVANHLAIFAHKKRASQ